MSYLNGQTNTNTVLKFLNLGLHQQEEELTIRSYRFELSRVYTKRIVTMKLKMTSEHTNIKYLQSINENVDHT